jgi:hypothetical protein
MTGGSALVRSLHRRSTLVVTSLLDSPLEEAVMSEPVSGGQFPGYWEK